MQADILVLNAGYVLMLLAFLARDILWLRALLMTGQFCVAFYGWYEGHDVIMAWNSVFGVINGAQTARLVMERRPIRLDPLQEAMYRQVFSCMTRREFLTLWEMGTLHAGRTGLLVREGLAPEELMLLVEGEVVVTSGGRTLARMRPGQFIAEMSFISGDPASADVHAASPVTFLGWSQSELRALRDRQPRLFMLMQGILGKDLVRKIRDTNLSGSA